MASDAQSLGPYRLVRQLGTNWRCDTYEARIPGVLSFWGHPVVKVHREMGPSATESLIQAGRAAARIHHAGLAALADLAEIEGRLIVVETQVDDAHSLAELRARGALSIEDAVDWTIQMCGALASAEPHLSHGAIWPPNIFVGAHGVMIDDLGTAWVGLRTALERGEVPSGRRRYLAPEQLLDGSADARSDVYAIARVLTALVSEDLEQVDALPDELATVVGRAMSHHARERQASPSALGAELAAWAKSSRAR